MDETLQRLGLNVNFPFVLTIASLIWARVLSCFSVIPFLFGKPTPRLTRVGASVVVTIFLYPVLSQGVELAGELQPIHLATLFLKEILFGLSLGFASAMVFYGFQSAGQMIDNQRGVSLARILIPELGEQASISSVFLFHFSVVLFLVLGGHRLFLKAFAESYLVLPLLSFPQGVEGLLPAADLFIMMTGKVIFISLQISAPVIIAILMADIILGVANRFAPQINVWELGFNIRGYLGILILFLSILFVANQVEHYTAETDRNVQQTIEYLKEKPPPPPVLEEPKEEDLKPSPPVIDLPTRKR